jgi:predicted AlkP superfamily pyrophosphatase or phosphodiesterase
LVSVARALLACAWLAAPAPCAAAATGAPVRLVLVVAVDQLRPDRLTPDLPGGLGRLVREGRVFREAALDHGMTETCPGHATMLTGHHPAAAGIPSNDFFDPESGAEVYCAADPSPGAREFGSDDGRSPAALRVTALGDWLKAVSPTSRVFAVSGKDRGAIMMGGQRPDGAFWYREGSPPRFTSSRYYLPALPAWVDAWNGAQAPEDGFLAAVPETWTYGPLPHPPRADDFVGEATVYSRTSPHPLRDPDLARFGKQLFSSPFLDLATLDFARHLVEQQDLGRGPATDLLALSLSATDSVGHLYGPFSQEAEDALLRLDEAFGRFLDLLEQRTGGALVVALTADHGVLPLPEWLVATGQATCPEPSGRGGIRRIGFGLLARLDLRLGPWFAWPRAWVHFAGSQGRVDRDLAARQGVAVASAVAATREYLESWPVIAHVWSEAEIASGTDDLAELYRHSFVPGRSGDFVVEPAEGCLLSAYDGGTSHGSPWPYDRRVPLIVRGPGIAPGGVAGPAATVDLGPTLAAWLGVPTPDGLDGRVLPLREREATP